MFVFYQSSNPCICTPSNVPSEPDCPEECNCINLCDISVNAQTSNDAVGPCAATGTLDISSESTYGHDFCACGADTQQWSIAGYDTEIFISASINKDTGVLTWVTQGPEALDKQYGNIVIKFVCGTLSTYMTVLIGIKDLCLGVVCDEGEECDPCDSSCIEPEIDLSVGQSPDSSDLAVNN